MGSFKRESSLGVYRIYKELHRSQWFSAEALAQLQQQRLHRLLEHAVKFIPYYRNISRGMDLDQTGSELFSSLPVLTRELLQANTKSLCDERTGEHGKKAVHSSGTTGMTVQVFLDKKSSAYSRALEKRGDYEWPGVSPWAKRITIIRHLKKKTRMSLLAETWRRSWRINIFDVTTGCFFDDAVFEQVINKMVRLKPDVIKGKHSSIRKIAQFIIENQPPLKLQAAISYAERFIGSTKALGEKAFGCRIYNKYGSSELGLVASECPEGQLHIHAERFIVEIVKDSRPVPPGTEGEIVVTDLVNYGFPLIRYATGDIGVIGVKPCSCGRNLPVLEKILGRVGDYIISPNGKKILAIHIDHIFEEFSQYQIKQVQLFQPALDQLIVRIVPGPGYTLDLNEKLLNLVESSLPGMELALSLEFCDRIMMTESGKYQFYRRGFSFED